jgi:hypothetical protein
MIYNYLLFFLGIYSWEFKSTTFFNKLFQKKIINENPSILIKNNIKLIDVITNENNINYSSPNLSIYIQSFNFKKLELSKSIQIYIYNLYSLIIFLLLCIQPYYLITQMNNNNFENIENYIITFLININAPINYLWSKYYFKTNHYDNFYINCNYNIYYLIIIIILTIGSIIYNLFNQNDFYNQYYFINDYNKNIGIPIIIMEWTYSRLILALNCIVFTNVFCKHTQDINLFIKKIYSNEFDIEDSYCLSNLIKGISNLRHSVEISINFFNTLISFITITNSLSLILFIRQKYNEHSSFKEIIFYNHDFYLIQCYLCFIIYQIIFFGNILIYSQFRIQLVKLIESSSFINKFLTRWSLEKIKKKSNDDNYQIQLNKMLLCIEEENATTLDWIILDKLLRNEWMDFSILGISTQDGSLIKKVIAFSSIIYIILGYI